MQSFKLLCLSLVFFATQVLAQTTNASSLKLSVYGVMVSTSSLCTNPVTIFNNAAPSVLDFITNPTLGSSGSPTNPPDGTYNCIIIKMSDNILYTPSASLGGICLAGTQYTSDVCNVGNGGTTNVPGSGVTTNCTNNPDVVYLYLTTNTNAGTGGGSFTQPLNAASTAGIKLTSPLVVSSNISSKFIVNATGKVNTAGGACGMNPPVFGFQ